MRNHLQALSQAWVVCAIAALGLSTAAKATEEEDGRVKIGDTDWVSIDSPHPYPAGQGKREVVWEQTFHHEGATFVHIHLASDTSLADGDMVFVTNADGEDGCTVTGADATDWWTCFVPGDTANLELVAGPDGGGHGVVIDRISWGTAPLSGDAGEGGVAGGDVYSICDTHVPSRIRTSDPVCRVAFENDCGGTYYCTGWLFSPHGHLMTNAHCANSQSEANSMGCRFNYVDGACDRDGQPNPDDYASDIEFIWMDCDLDVAVFKVNDPQDGNPADVYGYLPISPVLPGVGTSLWIPQHPGGTSRQVTEDCSIVDNNSQGWNNCEDPPDDCDATHERAGMTSLSYNCAQFHGSSGAPVLTTEDIVVAMVHAGIGAGENENNWGTRMVNFLSQFPEMIPISLILSAPDVVDELSSVQIEAILQFLVGEPVSVTTAVTWAVEPPSVASIDETGLLEAGEVEIDTPVTLHATFTWRDYRLDSEVTILVVDPSGSLELVASTPEDGAMDARQPSAPDGSAIAGWQVLDLQFNREPDDLQVDDFAITQQGVASDAPLIANVSTIGEANVRVTLDGIIPPRAWTTITHLPSNSVVRLGYLPGDVTGNRSVDGDDVLALVDALSGETSSLPAWSTDINRSGAFEPGDLLRLVDLLNGAGSYDAWLGTTLLVVETATVTVGNPGNAGELSGYGAGGFGPDRICGAVDYVYKIGKSEVTAGQYTVFLNAVAATDTYGLYNEKMDVDSGLPEAQYGCNIKRTGSSGSYGYSVAFDWADRPVNCVSWGDAARFANWLHNGQPRGTQDHTTTEDGAYYLNGATSEEALAAVVREPDARWAIPSEDEWYKAAYHKNDGVTSNYFDYATSSDIVPSNELIDPDPGNHATYYADSYTIGSPHYRTEVGAHENSVSPYGTYDQCGNVREWNEAVIAGQFRGLRGGSLWAGREHLPAAIRSYAPPTGEYGENYMNGFRVCEIR